MFHPDAHPTNVEARDLYPGLENEEKDRVREEIKDSMALHRSVMRGTGFWSWMVPQHSSDLSEDFWYLPVQDRPQLQVRTLPVVDYVENVDETYVGALLDECLPEDRPRYLAYLRRRILGVGLVVAVCSDIKAQ